MTWVNFHFPEVVRTPENGKMPAVGRARVFCVQNCTLNPLLPVSPAETGSSGQADLHFPQAIKLFPQAIKLFPQADYKVVCNN